MKLMFKLKFKTSDCWGEASHTHVVAVSDDFHALTKAHQALVDAGMSVMRQLFPKEAVRNNARYFPENEEWGSALDPNFQVIDGNWRYFLEPVVEYSPQDLMNLQLNAMKAAQLEGEGWTRVKRFEESLKNPQNGFSAEESPPTTLLGVLLAEKLTSQKL